MPTTHMMSATQFTDVCCGPNSSTWLQSLKTLISLKSFRYHICTQSLPNESMRHCEVSTARLMSVTCFTDLCCRPYTYFSHSTDVVASDHYRWAVLSCASFNKLPIVSHSCGHCHTWHLKYVWQRHAPSLLNSVVSNIVEFLPCHTCHDRRTTPI